jgi:hypothetical protein
LWKPLGLSHVDILLEVSIQVGRRKVNGTKLEIMLSSKSKDNAKCCRFKCRGEDLVVINAMALATTICYESRLVTLNGAIRLVLDDKDPL